MPHGTTNNPKSLLLMWSFSLGSCNKILTVVSSTMRLHLTFTAQTNPERVKGYVPLKWRNTNWIGAQWIISFRIVQRSHIQQGFSDSASVILIQFYGAFQVGHLTFEAQCCAVTESHVFNQHTRINLLSVGYNACAWVDGKFVQYIVATLSLNFFNCNITKLTRWPWKLHNYLVIQTLYSWTSPHFRSPGNESIKSCHERLASPICKKPHN